MRAAQRLLIVAIITANSAALAQTPAEPRIPQRPTSEADCDSWGKAFDEYWRPMISSARENDARCKATYTGKYKTISSLCPNAEGEVTYQNPCDDASKLAQCTTRRRNSGLTRCLDHFPKAKALATPSKTQTAPLKETVRSAPPSTSGALDCFPDTRACETACTKSGESDLLRCTKECSADDEVGHGYCFGRAQ